MWELRIADKLLACQQRMRVTSFAHACIPYSCMSLNGVHRNGCSELIASLEQSSTEIFRYG